MAAGGQIARLQKLLTTLLLDPCRSGKGEDSTDVQHATPTQIQRNYKCLNLLVHRDMLVHLVRHGYAACASSNTAAVHLCTSQCSKSLMALQCKYNSLVAKPSQRPISAAKAAASHALIVCYCTLAAMM